MSNDIPVDSGSFVQSCDPINWQEVKTQPFYIPKHYIVCPKHGEHTHYIHSTIEGHKGVWCQICWLETLGEPLQLHKEEKNG